MRRKGPRYQPLSRTAAAITISTEGRTSKCWWLLIAALVIAAAVLLPTYFLHVGVFKNSSNLDLAPITSLDVVIPTLGTRTWSVSSSDGLVVGQNVSIFSAAANVTISGVVLSTTASPPTVTVNETYIQLVGVAGVSTGPWVFTTIASLPSTGPITQCQAGGSCVPSDVACGASLYLSTVVASPPVVSADGMAYSVVTVSLVDLQSNPVQGVQVALASNRTNDMISNPSGASTTQGVVTFNARSELIGASNYTASVVC